MDFTRAFYLLVLLTGVILLFYSPLTPAGYLMVGWVFYNLLKEGGREQRRKEEERRQEEERRKKLEAEKTRRKEEERRKFEEEQTAKGLLKFKGDWLPESEVKKLLAVEHDVENDFQSFDAFEFEEFVAGLFTAMGYETELTNKTGDYGIDVIAERKNKGRGINDVVAIQVKHYGEGHNVGNRDVQRLLGSMRLSSVKANKGILITTTDFTRQAEEQAEGTDVELWNGEYLREMVVKYLIDKKVEEIKNGLP